MDGTDYKTLDYNGKIVIVIGNEGNGISSTMQNICTDTVTIPMQNQVESLNASVSGSIIMYFLSNK